MAGGRSRSAAGLAVDQHRGRVGGAGPRGNPAAHQRFRPGRQGLLHLGVHLCPQPLVHQRLRVEVPPLGLFAQCGNELVRDVAVHVDPLHGNADLPGIGESAECGLLGGPGRVHIGIDDQRIVAAVLQQHLRPGAGPGRGDAAPGGGAADVHHDVHAGQPRQRGADPAVTGHGLQHSVRAMFGEQPPEQRAGVRATLAGLVHHGISGGERGADQPGRDGDRIVPRGQRGHHAARLRDHEICCVPIPLQRAPAMYRAQLGVLVQRAGAGQYPLAPGGRRTTRLRLQSGGELVRVLAQCGRAGAQRGGTARRGRARPRRLRGARGAHDGHQVQVFRHRLGIAAGVDLGHGSTGTQGRPGRSPGYRAIQAVAERSRRSTARSTIDRRSSSVGARRARRAAAAMVRPRSHSVITRGST